MACGSPARHAPTGSGVTAVSRASGRLANARNASSCAPAGVAANAPTVNLRRRNRIRSTSQGTTTPSVGGAATANANTMASQLAVVSRLWPAPAISSAALLAAVSGSLTALPTSGMWSALWPADFRLSATPSAPPWT